MFTMILFVVLVAGIVKLSDIFGSDKNWSYTFKAGGFKGETLTSHSRNHN